MLGMLLSPQRSLVKTLTSSAVIGQYIVKATPMSRKTVSCRVRNAEAKESCKEF